MVVDIVVVVVVVDADLVVRLMSGSIVEMLKLLFFIYMLITMGLWR